VKPNSQFMEKTMCRIDAPYGNITFDEKNDPKERFVQALDEFEVQGNLRILLIKHFSESWKSVFESTDKFEEALDSAKQYDSEVKKCIAILLSQKRTITHSILRYFDMYKLPVNDSDIIGFLKDVAKAYYPNSPYGLFNDGMNKVEGYYCLFVSWLYGKDFCFSKEFFDDESLNSLNKNERTSIIWNYFNGMAHQFKSLEDSLLTKELASIASSSLVSGPLTKDSSEILRGFDFIKAWIKFDSQAGRFSYSWFDFFSDFDSPWGKIETLIRSEESDCKEPSKLLKKWLEDTKLEFEKLIYVSAGLNLVSDEDKKKWASGLDSYYISYTNTHIYSDYDYSQLTNDDLDIRLSNAHHKLCSELTPLQISTWIKYSVDYDFQRVIDSKQTRPDLLNSAEKWVCKEYFVAWKKVFLESLNDLVMENQLRILSSCSPFKRGQSKEFYSEFSIWWNGLFSDLIDSNDFPKNLIPDWTVVAVDRLKREDVFPYIDKSIGILRGELVKEECDEQIKICHQKLEKLLKSLDHTSSGKALRHRLLLMRSSKEPYSDESISKLGSPFERENFYKWYDSLKQLSDTHYAYQTNGNRDVTQDNYKQVQNDFYVNFSHELSEFCLSRLRLRRGEKAKDDKYDSNQVVEQSSIWRQGYLKALTELGFDLNGKVHKTVNFTKKSDPNEDVRSIASECYKAVRRHAKKSPSVQDIKRSIIAAEWWLLMCQRHELGLKVNHEEALKTRRNLMRNP
jgi:hypothetical protein